MVVDDVGRASVLARLIVAAPFGERYRRPHADAIAISIPCEFRKSTATVAIGGCVPVPFEPLARSA